MGKRILMATTGSLGDLHPFMAIGLGLLERGHSVTLATANFCRSKVQEAGLAFAPMGPHMGPEVTAAMDRIMDLRKGPEYLIRQILYPSIPAAYAEVMDAARNADLIVTHPITFAAQIAAERTGKPWVSTVTAPLSFFSRSDPAAIAGFPDLRSLGAMGAVLYRALLRLGRFRTGFWHKPVKRFRSSLEMPTGLDPLFEGQHSPERVLALFSPVMAEPQPDWPQHTLATGFPFYDQAAHGKGLDSELERFMAVEPAPVVFTLGSSAVQSPGSFYTESLIAIQKLGCRAVLLIGDNSPPEALPPGTIAVPCAPFSQVFPRAAVVVHQGGIGTCGQALAAGRPMLVVPFAFDQPDNAARLARLGIARTIPRAKYTGLRAASELGKLLNDPSYAANAAVIARKVAAEDGVRAACDAIEDLAVHC